MFLKILSTFVSYSYLSDSLIIASLWFVFVICSMLKLCREVGNIHGYSLYGTRFDPIQVFPSLLTRGAKPIQQRIYNQLLGFRLDRSLHHHLHRHHHHHHHHAYMLQNLHHHMCPDAGKKNACNPSHPALLACLEVFFKPTCALKHITILASL